MNVLPPCARPSANRSRMVGGAFFQTRVLIPRITASSISNGEPGWVSRACAWATDMAGQGVGGGVIGRSQCDSGPDRMSFGAADAKWLEFHPALDLGKACSAAHA